MSIRHQIPFTIEKKQIKARRRNLKARWTMRSIQATYESLTEAMKQQAEWQVDYGEFFTEDEFNV